jgi:Domain of unknown function (DUF1772)
MPVYDLARLAALLSILGTGVVYGTDVFCALVLRPALAAVDDRALVAVTGNVHFYGDRRMPLPGVVGLLGAAASAALFGVTGHWANTVAALAAITVLLVWLMLYLRISAPINKQLTSAARTGDAPSNARVLQRNWDRIITARAALQGAALIAMCAALTI